MYIVGGILAIVGVTAILSVVVCGCYRDLGFYLYAITGFTGGTSLAMLGMWKYVEEDTTGISRIICYVFFVLAIISVIATTIYTVYDKSQEKRNLAKLENIKFVD